MENDDVTFTASQVLELCNTIGTPMIYDIFHHQCLPGEGVDNWQMELEEMLPLIVETWGGRVPKMHVSSQKADGTRTSHADFILPSDFALMKEVMSDLYPDKFYDVMVEAKMKELAVLTLMGKPLPNYDKPGTKKKPKESKVGNSATKQKKNASFSTPGSNFADGNPPTPKKKVGKSTIEVKLPVKSQVAKSVTAKFKNAQSPNTKSNETNGAKTIGKKSAQ